MPASIMQMLLAEAASGPSWTTTFSQTLNISDTPWVNTTFRIVVPDTLISASGSEVRVTLQTGFDHSCALSEVWIGEKASSGDAYDMKASTPAPAQFLFSGAANVTIPANSQVLSDALVFALDETKSYVFGLYITSGDIKYKAAVSGAVSAFQSGSSEAGIADATSGYSSLGANVLALIAKIEVQ